MTPPLKTKKWKNCELNKIYYNPRFPRCQNIPHGRNLEGKSKDIHYSLIKITTNHYSITMQMSLYTLNLAPLITKAHLCN